MPAEKNGGKDETWIEFFPTSAGLSLVPPPPDGKKIHEILSLDVNAAADVRVPDPMGCKPHLELVAQKNFEYVRFEILGPGCFVYEFFTANVGKSLGLEAKLPGTYMGHPVIVSVSLAAPVDASW
jgi:hypothetical protein